MAWSSWSITSTHVNDYLRSLARGDRSAKDFRTWGGTVVAAGVLVDLGPAATAKEADHNTLVAIDTAAEKLGNTRAVARSSYVHPQVADAYRNGSLAEAWRRSRGAPRLNRAERTVLKVLEAG